VNLALIPLFPLVGFLINGIWYAFFQAPQGRKAASASVTGTIATLAIFASFVVSVLGFVELLGRAPEERMIEQFLFSWFSVGGLSVDVTLRLDALSSLFALVITGVGSLIHLYSIGYMSEDATPGKFFCYLNLFCFAMLMLVLGGSLPVLFLGWEGVGLCSYLLIGYWYEDIEKAKAGKKAFVANRVGDLGFLIGLFLIWTAFGTLDFVALKDAVTATGATVPAGMITAICLFLFLGCTGKSAQIPLYVWLPDAMAGPTPVSALIHAATMVTSGIYLVARLNFLYDLSPTALHVVAWTGALTAIFAATIAITQRDIKKVLAYSTVSQLGYMFLACGVGAYGAGVFHVITHAFFKALLFLGAGSVIHGMHHEQDIMKMGGLSKKMPQTYWTFVFGWLAICGIPVFSGFFSKDEILWLTFSSHHGSVVLWGIGAVTAILTAFYMTRMFTLTFHSSPRWKHSHGQDHDHSHEPHESPWTMTLPLMVLAILSLVGGFMGIPHASWLGHWLAPVIPEGEHAVNNMEWVLMGLSVIGAVIGIFTARKLYAKDLGLSERLKKKYGKTHQASESKWYVDELYEAIVIRPIGALSQALWKVFDVGVIDRIVLSFGWASMESGQRIRTIQSGSIQVYATVLLIGLILTLGYLIHGLV
jgi:NADH-quinone oxidoreductase subunit L